MNKDELRAVLAHEIGHVANGDMVTLALIQGVVNAFVMFFARVAGDFIDRNVFGREDGEYLRLGLFCNYHCTGYRIWYFGLFNRDVVLAST